MNGLQIRFTLFTFHATGVYAYNKIMAMPDATAPKT